METYGNVTEDGQQDVDEEVGVAATLEEDTKRGQDNGEDDLADIAGWLLVRAWVGEAGGGRRKAGDIPGGERHGDGWCGCCYWGKVMVGLEFEL